MRRLTLRRYLSVFLPIMFLILCFSLYLMMESVSVYSTGPVASEEHFDSELEMKLHQIGEDLKTNQRTINRIKKLIREIAQENGHNNLSHMLENIIQDKGNLSFHDGLFTVSWMKKDVRIPLQTCKLAQTVPPKVDIQMGDIYEKLPFDNPDGGVWKQGFDITYDPNQWNKEKLKVFVVPHSHDDPGWIKTFEMYHQDQTRHILNLMVDKLEAYPTMRFIYAEMSFFWRWWSQIDGAVRNRVKKLLAEKRLELVTGGWVMTDEATSHYFAIIDQMIEGNQWILNELGVIPVSGWAVDPFGYSPTMAYLLQQHGFKNMLIQRAHYSIKKYLSQNKQLEFMWRQIWDTNGRTDMFCHLMPFYSYDVPHTCGPNPKVCCQFDFKRLSGGSFKCPWNVPPVVINRENVAERAELLLDQYRQKAQLYRNSVVLAPLGDDFRYDKPEEWDNQHDNYKMIMDHINSNSKYNAEVKFGTLTDYFDALRERAGRDANANPAGYPVLSGDFFSYADRDDHYWTGYFTSRPFYKRLDRLLESNQRSGEILFSLALAEARRLGTKAFPADALLSKIVSARRSLGLFQHHDAIAGTAKDFVVVDYGEKLLQALSNMKQVIIDSAQFLLTADKSDYHYPDVAVFDVDEKRAAHDALPDKTVIRLTSNPRIIVFYNSIAHNRTSSVTVFVDNPHVEVRHVNGELIPTQVSPCWTTSKDISRDVYQVNFVVTLPALGLVKYYIIKTKPGVNVQNAFAKVTVYNSPDTERSQVGPFEVEKLKPITRKISMENEEMRLQFSSQTGLLEEVFMKESHDTVKASIAFVRYGARPGKERSGAYLFIPDGDARTLHYDSYPVMSVAEGPLVSEVKVSLPHVDHAVRVINSQGVDSSTIEITNLVDIRQEGNAEVAMRIMTDLSSGDEFFTDLNGFQVIRRRTYEKLPLNANFYPMATMAFLEDKQTRFSVLSGQSLGVASLKTGWLEVMQDRRLDQDDHRGLGQPVHDNKVTPNLFRLLIERHQLSYASPVQPAGYPSLLGHIASLQMLHPVYFLPAIEMNGGGAVRSLLPSFEPLQLELPCDMHLVNLRTLLKPEEDGGAVRPAAETALIFHRFGVDCRFPTEGISCHFSDGQVSLSSMFRTLRISGGSLTTLSLTQRLSRVNSSSVVNIQPMELQALSVTLL